ncbi:MAG: hypothetical protein IPO93_01955 [Actinobacteria bacterium]|jgi:hypothetical protein|nr:hypothetical protein [Actinomycetota bacterium]
MGVLRVGDSDNDAILPVSLGTIVWLVVLVGLIIRKPELDASGATWWIGAAAVGVVSGVGGVVFLRWRRARMDRRRA